MRTIYLLIVLAMLPSSFVYANTVCDFTSSQLISFGNISFNIPDCLALSIEDGNNVYRFKDTTHKGYIMVNIARVSSQQMYENLKQLGKKLTYLTKEIVYINGITVTLISFKSYLEDAVYYKTYVFEDIGIKFTTRETQEDHSIFLCIVNSVKRNK